MPTSDASDSFRRFPPEAVDGSIGERFTAVATEFGDAVALRSPAGSWTYAELLAEVRSHAGGLVDRLGADAEPVAIVADHDGPLVVAVLSVIVAGHLVVVLDPAAPRPQLEQILAECRPRLILHDDAQAGAAAELAAGADATAVDLTELAGTLPDAPHRTADSPMMLAFTSGTSGLPKGAMITHGVLLNLVRGATDVLQISPDDTMPMLFPVSLAVAAYPMFLPLLNGGTLSTHDVRSLGLAGVADFLADERITLAYLAPTVVRFLVDALAGRTFEHLRMVALGGEVVDAEVVELVRTLFDPRLIANGYGTTETGVITLQVIDPADPPDGDVPVGHPVEDVAIAIVDDDGRELPAGEPGEIVVRSRYTFGGYWGHPELNRRVLSPDPEGRSGWRQYRTGDYGHLRSDGALVVSGRVDYRVKVRGRFVVLSDVEQAVRGLDGVADAAVTSVVRNGVVELVAHVVPDGAEPVSGPAWRAALLDHQEAYRVPTHWMVVDELPRLPNGKVDRRALPHPDADAAPVEATVGGSSGSPGRAAPDRGAAEELRHRIRTIWERLLPVGTVDVDEDFFALGGDSLLAAQMLVLVEHELGVTVPMARLVHARTVRRLAHVIVQLRAEAGSSSVSTVACVQEGDESRRPRLWFVHDLQGSAFRVRHLAAALGDDQPVWSFESPLLRGDPPAASTLETFVARYATDLRRSQPEGPYWVAGYSFGGLCAYELARQLSKDGHEVAFVGVVDIGPGYRGESWRGQWSPLRPWFGVAKPPEPGTPAVDRARYYLDMLRTSPSGAARHLMVRSGVSRLVDPVRFRADLRRHGRVRPEWRLWYAWEQHWKLAARHWDRGHRYPGAVDLFWAEASASADATMGWGSLAGDVAVHRFRGDHDGVLEPRGAPALAAVLRRVIDERLSGT